MGAATSITSGGWFFAEAVDVVLVLNDARNIALLEREELSALVHLNPDDSGRFILTRESPASLSLTSTKIVVIEFQGIIQGQQDSARCLGEVILPVHHIARQCAGSLYQVWLPLQPASALLREDDHIDHFEKALLKSARDPRRPMVCLSLYAGSIPQASRNYLFDASEKEKAARVLGLMQSYSQHARMLQALYREVRSSQASAQLDTSGLADSWPSRRPEMGSPVAEFSPEARRDADEADASPTDVRAAVREEIRETQAEADERLRKADKTIQALRGMINDKQVELIQRRKEVSRLKHEAESLQLENEKLEVQLSRSSLRGVTAADSVEAANLEKEAEELKTQKEALLVLRRDFYRAMGQEPPSLAAMVSKHQADARNKVVEPDKATECEHAAPVVQEWTNMLPRPSELLLSGLEERFANDN